MKESKIIGALIGLAGACSSNPKTNATDALVIKALSIPLTCPQFDDAMLQEIVQEIHSEKNTIAPGCAQCAAPCGNTSDYDMNRIYEAGEEISNIKLKILSELQRAAVYISECQETELTPEIDYIFFYKGLSYLSYDLDKEILLDFLKEAEKIGRR